MDCFFAGGGEVKTFSVPFDISKLPKGKYILKCSVFGQNKEFDIIK